MTGNDTIALMLMLMGIVINLTAIAFRLGRIARVLERWMLEDEGVTPQSPGTTETWPPPGAQ